MVKRSRFEPKYMFTFFFKSDGPMHVSYYEEGQLIMWHTLNQHWNLWLSWLKRSDQNVAQNPKIAPRQRPTSCWKNHRKGFIIEHDMTTMGHPPYSPDLAPFDFWLNSYIKVRLVEQPNVEALHPSITEIITSVPKFEYQRTFNKWVERMGLCIKYEGDYFEHLIK